MGSDPVPVDRPGLDPGRLSVGYAENDDAVAGAIEAAGPHACIAGPHSGTITTQEWCLADSPHVLTGNVTVASGSILTIEPGVIVMACDGCGILVQGDLVAVGTAGQPILFTSTADSGPGQWAGLRFNGYVTDGDGTPEYVTVRYGGDANQGVYANVSVNDDRSHVTIRHSHILSEAATGTDCGVSTTGAHVELSDTVVTGSGD